MKKTISLLLIVVLIIALAIPAVAATMGDRQGVIKAFSEESVTLNVAGKDYTYTIDSSTEVKRIDQDVDFLDVAKKGIKVNFKNSDSKLTYINIPNIGAEMQGLARVAVSDIRVNRTDSALPVVDAYTSSVDATTEEITQTIATKKVEVGFVDCDEYVYDNDKQITLGDIVIDPASVKVAINHNALKVITDGKTEFDPKVVGDEVKLVQNKTMYTMVFEAPVTDIKTPKTDYIQMILNVNYKKQMFDITTNETNFLRVEEDAVVELNGKEVSLAKAMNLGNYWFVRTNPDGFVIHVDSFYRDAEAVFTGLANGLIKVDTVKGNKVVGSDVLTPSEGLTILAANGSEISVNDLKVNDKIKVTTEPADGHRVTFIQQK